MSSSLAGNEFVLPNGAAPQGFTTQQIALTLARGVMAAYDAYDNGANNTPVLAGYGSITPIYIWETDPNGNPFSSDSLTTTVALAAPALSRRPVTKLRAQPLAAAYCAPPATTSEPSAGSQLMGFSAVANDNSHNLLVLRGTATLEEAGYDMLGWGTNTPCLLPSGSDTQTACGNVNSALYDIYVGDDYGAVTSLASSFQSAVQALDLSLPLLVGAHSLGGPLVELGMLDAIATAQANDTSFPQPIIVTFGGLHLGDAAFATAYKSCISLTLRVANLCDFVPSMISLAPVTYSDPYVHVGVEATFVWQTWSDWGNHSMECIYLEMMQQPAYWSLIKFGPRTYPQ